MQKWEYWVHLPRELGIVELNKLGEQGWELIFFSPPPPNTGCYRYIFKRPKQEKLSTLTPSQKEK